MTQPYHDVDIGTGNGIESGYGSFRYLTQIARLEDRLLRTVMATCCRMAVLFCLAHEAVAPFAITFFFPDKNEPQPERTTMNNLESAQVKDGNRLLAAFAILEKAKRKKVVALAESMVAIDR